MCTESGKTKHFYPSLTVVQATLDYSEQVPYSCVIIACQQYVCHYACCQTEAKKPHTVALIVTETASSNPFIETCFTKGPKIALKKQQLSLFY